MLLPMHLCRDHPDLLLEPSRIFNRDETCFLADAGVSGSWQPRAAGAPRPLATQTGTVTLLITISADGGSLPPYVKGSGAGPPNFFSDPELEKVIAGVSNSERKMVVPLSTQSSMCWWVFQTRAGTNDTLPSAAILHCCALLMPLLHNRHFL